MKFMCLCWKSVKTTRSNKESRRVLLMHCVSIPFNSIFPAKHLCRGCLGRAVLFFRNNATSRSGTNGNMLALDTKWRFECKKSTISQPAGLHVLQPTVGFGTFFSGCARKSIGFLATRTKRPAWKSGKSEFQLILKAITDFVNPLLTVWDIPALTYIWSRLRSGRERWKWLLAVEAKEEGEEDEEEEEE